MTTETHSTVHGLQSLQHPSPAMQRFFAKDIETCPWLGEGLQEQFPLPAVPSFRPPAGDDVTDVLSTVSTATFDSAQPYAFLVAANSVSGFNSRETPEKLERLDRVADSFKALHDTGTKIIVDSGVFELAGQYAKEHNVHLTAAMVTPPSGYVKFSAYLRKYVLLMERIKGKVWGYVEIDLGTFADRKVTRTMLATEYDLHPMPVFRAGVDDWENLRSLCEEGHPLICLAGTAHCPRKYSMWFWQKAWSILRDYPETKTHVLGVSWRAAFIPYAFASSDNASFAATNINGSTSARGLNGSGANLWPTYPIGHSGDGTNFTRGDIRDYNNHQANAQTMRCCSMLLYSTAYKGLGLKQYSGSIC